MAESVTRMAETYALALFGKDQRKRKEETGARIWNASEGAEGGAHSKAKAVQGETVSNVSRPLQSLKAYRQRGIMDLKYFKYTCSIPEIFVKNLMDDMSINSCTS